MGKQRITWKYKMHEYGPPSRHGYLGTQHIATISHRLSGPGYGWVLWLGPRIDGEPCGSEAEAVEQAEQALLDWLAKVGLVFADEA